MGDLNKYCEVLNFKLIRIENYQIWWLGDGKTAIYKMLADCEIEMHSETMSTNSLGLNPILCLFGKIVLGSPFITTKTNEVCIVG